MSEFESLGLKGGVWAGRLKREQVPERVLLVHMGDPVAEARPQQEEDGAWRIEIAVPANRLSDGVQSFMLMADQGAEATPGVVAERLAVLNIVAGRPLEMDLRAEIDLIRAELDLLKRELRRMATSQG
ncbi:hypothetical protein [Paracoccus aerodenitrificans]|uniref:hypothetical protein n=1 Tax=Paracoccus aerodenitrificans TaxID=3017781 RepID=UPI0022EFDDC2|nr:hypothetical protein [Paracoccus aerodenitrificans]WBU62989.1 hypothetical protein PAE61_11500 [Paracoccus aerodenitrificans]